MKKEASKFQKIPEKKPQQELSLKWLIFCKGATGWILAIYATIFVTFTSMDPVGFWPLIGRLSLLIPGLIMWFALKYGRAWAWYYILMYWCILPAIAFVEQGASVFIYFVLLFALISMPNIFYFNKRKYLFQKPSREYIKHLDI